MKTMIVSALLTALPGRAALTTEYKTERALRIEIETDLASGGKTCCAARGTVQGDAKTAQTPEADRF